MTKLPPAKTPLNQHSLTSIELWLSQLGAQKGNDNPCLWTWNMPEWSAEISIKQEELIVVWNQGETKSQFGFPYGLSRQDIEAALKHGP